MLSIKELQDGEAPKELEELSGKVHDLCDGKPSNLVVSAMLTILGNAIENEERVNQLFILKGLTDFILVMGGRAGLENMPDPYDEQETKVANVEDDITDSRCEGCGSCDKHDLIGDGDDKKQHIDKDS